MRQIAVIGLGKFGNAVARELMIQGAEVIAIDRRKEAVEAIQDVVTYAATLNATDVNALRGVNVHNVDAAVVCIGEEVEANLLATLLLKKIGVKQVWARAISPLQQEILGALDVDAVLSLENDMGRTVARRLVSTSISSHIPLGKGYSIADVDLPASFVGKTIRKIAVRKDFQVNIIAIRRRVPEITETGERSFGEEIENIVSADTVFNEGDVLIVVGHDRDLIKLSKA
jgi:trk system potassium uptake protein TrkA